MRLIELECSNCGASLKIAEGENSYECPYCKAQFKLDEENAEKSGYEFEKGRIKARTEHTEEVLQKNRKTSKIIIAVFIIIFLSILILPFTLLKFNTKSGSSTKEEISAKQQEFEIKSFNSKFEIYSNAKSKIQINSLLDEVANNNRTNNKNLITINFEDEITNVPDKIIAIKDKLEDSTSYNTSFKYDSNGFVNQINIK